MARKKKEVVNQVDPFLEDHEDRIMETPAEEILVQGFERYSKSVILDRALPSGKSGCKPVVRRILYSMYRTHNTYDKPYHKSMKAIGDVLGNFHPHGDSSVYDAMVRLSQDWKLNLPLIDMQGNNGSIDGDSSAAARYTESRLSKIANYMLMDIDKDTVDWVPNFSDEILEPVELPVRFPHLLTSGQMGIASGYATNIPPHNLNETVNATIERIKNPECTLDDIMKHMIGPDFPTGATVLGTDGIKKAFKTGKGKVTVRSKYTVTQEKGIIKVVITEIPYDIVKSAMVKQIDDIRLEKKIHGILDVRDESDYTGLRVVIELKKDAPVDSIMNYLFKNTDLQANYNYNLTTIINKTPQTVGIIPCLDEFITFRKDVVTRRTKFELKEKHERMHILEGFIKAMDILDEVVHTIRASKHKQDAKTNLIDKFGFSEKQAEAIVSMRLYRLTNTDVNALKDEYTQLKKDVEFLDSILADEEVLKQVIISELEEINSEFPTPRKTVIEGEEQELIIDHEAMIPKEQVMVAVTRDGYYKRVSMRSYGASSDEMFAGRKEDDHMVLQGEVNTRDKLIFFTKQGKYGIIPVYKIPEAKWKDLGSHISSQMKMDMDDKVIAGFAFDKISDTDMIISITKKGQIKGTLLKDCDGTRFAKLPAFQGLGKDDEVVKAVIAKAPTDRVYLTTSDGLGLTYPVEQVSLSGLKARGVKGINLNKEATLVDIFVTDKAEDVIIGDYFGHMKHINTDYYADNNRPAKGKMICKKGTLIDYAIPTTDGFKYFAEDSYEAKLEDLPLDGVQVKTKEPYGTYSKPIELLQGIEIVKNEEA